MPVFIVDPADPAAALEDCGLQLDLLTDLICQDSKDGIMLGEMATAGLSEMLRAVSRTLNKVSELVRQPAASARESLPHSEAAMPVRAATVDLDSLLARVTEADRDTISAGASRPPAPRLVERRPTTARRKAA